MKDMKPKTDGVAKRFQSRSKKRLVASQEFLSGTKKLLFAAGIILAAGLKKNLKIFITGGGVLLVIFTILASIGGASQISKKVLGTATSGLGFLEARQFEMARQSFEQAQSELSGSNTALVQIISKLPVGNDVNQLLEASSETAKSLSALTRALNKLETAKLGWNQETNSSDQRFYFELKAIREDFVESGKSLAAARLLIDDINPGIVPGSFRDRFRQAQKQLATAQGIIEAGTNAQSFILNLLGGEPKTYLLIFQNNNEARATGGFIGTYGVVKFYNGAMRIEKIESIYATDGQLKELIAAPGPMQRKITDHWGMRDANWFVDFPESAKKILAFYEKESGVLADGILSFTPDIFEKLLALTGPIPMPAYGVILDAANFRDTVQYKTSIDYDRKLNEPKKLLSDFAPLLLGKLQELDQAKQFSLFGIFSEMAAEKQIMMFSLDPDHEQQIRESGLAGEIKKTDGDFLAIIHSNLGGGKTDTRIGQRVEKRVTIAADGKTRVELRIARTHGGFNEKFFPDNFDYMRILAPAGAALISASGFDTADHVSSVKAGALTDPELEAWDSQIVQDPKTGMFIGRESGYTEFSSWLELSPGQTRTVELVYELPFPSRGRYTQVLQKQPGAAPFEFSFSIDHPGKAIYQYPENFESIVAADKFYGVIWK